MDGEGQQQTERFFGAAKIMAGLTMLSRVLGLVREAALTALGATAAMDAFRVAFSIPNLFRRLFGEGATAAAFVPVFTEASHRDGWEDAKHVLANVGAWLAVILVGVSIIVELAVAGWLIAGEHDANRRLMLQLVMIVLPFMTTVCLLALGSAAAQCKGHFAYPAFAPVLLNVFLIAAAGVCFTMGWGDRPATLYLLAASVVAAGGVQLAGLWLVLGKLGLAAWPRLRPVRPEVRRVARLAGPMILPMGVMQFSAFFDRIWAFSMAATEASPTFTLLGQTVVKPLEAGVVTCFDNASRMYQLPLGILAVSLATAVFPLFSRHAAAGDVPGLRQAVNRALRLSFFLGIPAGVGLALLAGPVITVLFLRGRYTPADAASSAYILQLYAAGMWAYFANHILLRAFFSVKDTKTPLYVACSLTVVNIAMVVTLVFTPLREGALGLATATTASITMVLLTAILRRRWGQIGLRAVAGSLVRVGVATAAMAGAVWAVRWTLAEVTDPGMTRAALQTAGGVLAGAGTYLLATLALRCPELGELIGRR